MLKATRENLSSDDKALVRKWLTEPGAKVFIKLVSSKLHENQIEATRQFCDFRDSNEKEGRVWMKKSEIYRHTLEVMGKISDPKEELYTVKVTET